MVRVYSASLVTKNMQEIKKAEIAYKDYFSAHETPMMIFTRESAKEGQRQFLKHVDDLYPELYEDKGHRHTLRFLTFDKEAAEKWLDNSIKEHLKKLQKAINSVPTIIIRER